MNSPAKISISVVIPLFNKQDSINETIESVLKQTFSDYELLIIDDGSTDDSLKLIEKITDSRIKVYSKENGGVSDTRNFGIGKAQGEFVFLLDADDIIKADCLETLYELSMLFPEESVFCGNFDITESNTTVRASVCQIPSIAIVKEPLKELWKGGIFLRTGNMLVRSECFKVVGGFDTQFSYYEDMDHILNLIRKFNVVFDPKVIFSYQLEYNYLSSKTVSINKDWTCHVDFNNRSHYEKLIVGSVIYSSFRKRLRSKDYFGCCYLLKKHKLNLHYVFGCKILKKLKL